MTAPARPRGLIEGSARPGPGKSLPSRCRCLHMMSRHKPAGDDPWLSPCRVPDCTCPSMRAADPFLFVAEKLFDLKIQRTLLAGQGGGLPLKRWIWTYHTFNSARSTPGMPDRLYLRRVGPGVQQGASMYREEKIWGEYPSDDQMDVLLMLRADGQDADWWTPDDYLSGRIAQELTVLAGLTPASTKPDTRPLERPRWS